MTTTEQQVAREQQARIAEHRGGLRCLPTASLALERVGRESVPASLVLAVGGQR